VALAETADDAIWRLRDVMLRGRASPRLDRVTLDIPRGITAVLGASGAGKTSLLNLLVGFERADAGEGLGLRAEGLGTEKTSSHSSSPSLSPQPSALSLYWSPPDHGLWPHRTVRAHLMNEDQLLDAFALRPLADVYPATLSTGERSRLSVARAVSSGARVLVLDEPFAHVDGPLRTQLWDVLIETVRRQRQSLVFATHHADVAVGVADHAICLASGRVLAAGSPQTLYRDPPSRDVAELFGPCNWLEDDFAVWLPGATSRCVRPEQLSIEPADESSITVQSAVFHGAHESVALRHEPTGLERRFLHRPSHPRLRPGQLVMLRLLSIVLLVALCIGCETGFDRPLAVRSEAFWTLPLEGTKLPAPRAIAAGPDDEFYALDTIGRVIVLDDRGAALRQWWMPEYSVGRPERVLVCRDGTLAIADTHYHRVVLFDRNGELKSMFGSRGEGPGEFIYPVAIAEDDERNLYVCEYGGHDRVQVFRPDGMYVREFGGFGTRPGEFQRPSGILWRDRRLFIVDAFNNRVQVFHDDGRLVDLSPDKFAAELHYPYDIAGGPDGRLYVVEYGAGRVTCFAADGMLLGRYGQSGAGSGQLSRPWGLCVDGMGRVLVADTDNRRIVRWELGK
jgi:ABC-type sulfate/molybdate transport systems ATPase subunit/sugar lactone lactonase YvrE